MIIKYIDLPKIQEHFEGDEDILSELITEFIIKNTSLINELELAIIDLEFEKIKIQAHTLKGLVSNFYAEEIRLGFFELENRGLRQIDNDNLTYFKDLKTKFLIMIDELKVFNENLKKRF
jgi:HPt (histidine-containing phosphotransfer) domain-containing protein